MFQHIFPSCNIRKENPIQIDINYLIPLLICHFLCRSVDADSCVIMAEIKSSQLLYDMLHHCFYLFFICTVSSNGDDFPSCLFRQFPSGLPGLVNIQIHDSYISASLCERSRRTLSDSSRCSCYKPFLSIQSHFFNNSHSVLLSLNLFCKIIYQIVIT